MRGSAAVDAAFPVSALGDAIAPGILLAQAIGRIGNYFNQELYGRETTVPWGLEIFERVNSSASSINWQVSPTEKSFGSFTRRSSTKLCGTS